jgi:aromatic ring-opening dioxygenase LigB subunit
LTQEMGVVFACIMPHGAEAIPQLAEHKQKVFSTTTQNMESIAAMIRRLHVDTVIIATPHNLRLKRNIGVILTEFTEGTLRTENASVQIRLKCDRALAESILKEAEATGLPVVGVNYGTNEGESSCMPMDWGTLIPLWFLKSHIEKLQVVMVTPSREISLQKLVKFGTLIARAAEKHRAQVAFVASADQAHTHKKSGPYGFHPDSAKFDQLIVDMIKQNKLEDALRLDEQLIENAKPDSIWQMAILIGILKKVPMQAKLLSYQAPTYFGMLCAAFTLN